MRAQSRWCKKFRKSPVLYTKTISKCPKSKRPTVKILLKSNIRRRKPRLLIFFRGP